MNHLKQYRTLLFMVSATFLGKVLGMLRDVLLAYHYGTDSEAVAFITASRLPLNFFDFALGAVIGSAFIPIFNEAMEKESPQNSRRLANEFVNIIMIIGIIMTVFGISFTPAFVRLIAGGLPSETFLLSVKLARMMFPMLIFTALTFAFVGILQSLGEFNVPAAISVIANLIMIGYLLIFNERFGIEGMAVAMVIGWFFQMAIQLPVLYRYKYPFKFVFRFKSPYLKQIVVVMLPILISTWVQPINVFINTYLAARIGDGSGVAVLEYANKVFIIIAGVFILALSNLIFPSLSRLSNQTSDEDFLTLLRSALQALLYFMLPLTLGIMVFNKPLIQLMYERGAFTHQQTIYVASALLFYGIGILGYGYREILNKAFYAKGNAKAPMIIAIVGIAFNVIMSLLLVKWMGLNGLALASSLSGFFISAILIWWFRKHGFHILRRQEHIYGLKAVTATAVMTVVVYIYRTILEARGLNQSTSGLVITLLGGAGLGLAVYFTTARILNLNIPAMNISQSQKGEETP